MYVCLCHGITEQQMADQVQKNKNISFKELCQKLKIGKDCGSCLEEALEQTRKNKIILQHKQKKNS